MSLKDYCVEIDFFELDNNCTSMGDWCFPCGLCVYRVYDEGDGPCAVCQHRGL